VIINNNTSNRIVGLASGLDTDQIIKDMMRVQRAPLDRLLQKRELEEWKRDSYRDITNLLRGLKDEHFNYLKPASNMLSPSTYKKYSASSSNSGVVSVSTNAEAVTGTHTISVARLATADKAVSTGSVTKALEAVPTGDYMLGGKKINIELDGVKKELVLDDYYDLNELITKADTGLQALVDKAFGTGKIVVGNVSGKLNFSTGAGANKITLTSGSKDDGLASLGFSSGSSNRLNTSSTLEALAGKLDSGLTFSADDKLVFKINNKEFSFSKTTTLSSMISTINSEKDANVNIAYDEITDKFTITAKQMGAGDNIVISQTGGSFFDGASKISIASPVQAQDQGVDAEVVIDGQSLVRSSNTFSVNGVTYTINKVHADPATEKETISITQDTDGIFNNIKGFVDKYNEIIETINGKLTEKYDRSYLPLTKEQKEAMSKEEIEKWEKTAKTGLLRNDPILSNVLSNLRKALFDKIEGSGVILSDIGIDTGNYFEKGKLKIDETKLREAIANNPDGIANLFNKTSTTHPSYSRELSSDERTVRYNEEGIIQRFSDIIEDNITTLRDKNGNKGILLEKAGITNDTSEFNNTIFKQISDYDTRIRELEEKLIKKEDSLYARFTAMEKALANMNSQSNWLISQFQGG